MKRFTIVGFDLGMIVFAMFWQWNLKSFASCTVVCIDRYFVKQKYCTYIWAEHTCHIIPDYEFQSGFNYHFWECYSEIWSNSIFIKQAFNTSFLFWSHNKDQLCSHPWHSRSWHFCVVLWEAGENLIFSGTSSFMIIYRGCVQS